MRIARLDLTPVAVVRETGFLSRHVVVRLESEQGEVGWGEMSDLGHLPAYLPDLGELERTLRGLLVGRDPRPLARWAVELREWFPEAQYYYDMGNVIRAGVDIALHDLVARGYGVPVTALLGGSARDSFPVCYPIFRLTSVVEVEANLDRVAQRIDEGFDRFRLYVGRCLEADRRFLEGFDERFGQRAQIKALDFSHLLGWKDSLAWAERLVEVCRPEMIESPAPQLDVAGLREFRLRSRVAVSEHAFATRQATELLRAGAVDILNVCVTFSGGLEPARELLALARCHGVGALIGTTQELSVGTAAQAQLGCAAGSLTHPGDPVGPRLYRDDITTAPVEYRHGALVAPDGVGLGVTVDPERVAALAAPLAWDSPSTTGSLDRTAG